MNRIRLKLDSTDQITQQFRRQAEALLNSKVISKEKIVLVLGRPQILTRGPGDAVKITFGSDRKKGLIPFDYACCDVRDDAKAQLNELGKALCSTELSEYVFEISGHTDIRGSEAYNQDLSLKRAGAVRKYLMVFFIFPRTD